MNRIDSKRIEWVDIFKALTIISVVVGHSTGKYNMFIYQFHMAAFFFISGYTTNLKKRGIIETIWDKLCTMLLPVLSIFAFGLCFVAILNYAGFYQYLFQDPFIGVAPAIAQFVTNGNNFVLWMGATWFIIVLFCSVIVQKCIYRFFNNKATIGYMITTFVLFLMGYFLVKSGIRLQISIFSIDLVLIAQFYFGIGVISREFDILKSLSSRKIRILFVTLLSMFLFYYFGVVDQNTVDFASRRFGIPFIDALAAINGIVLVYLMSILFEKMLAKKIKTMFMFIGKNTIGIVFFHFMFFKVPFSMLYFAGVVPIAFLKNFVPTAEVAGKYWWLVTIISILLSIAFWKLITLVKPMKIILGEEKGMYSNGFSRISKLSIIREINAASIDISSISGHWDKVVSGIKKNYVYFYLISLITILSAVPILKQGIICNDELLTRVLRFSGFKHLIVAGLENEIRMGRPMRFLAAFTQAMGFISTKIIIFRSIQVGLLTLSVGLFGYFVYRLFGNKKFSVFLSVFILIFLPITFEHAVPNAFIGLICIPMSVLLLSFIYYLGYLESNKLRCLVISAIFFFISMLCYEFLVTYVLVFPMIYLLKSTNKNFKLKHFVKRNVIPLSIGFCYLSALFMIQKLFPANYQGAKLGFVSVTSSLTIIINLFMSSLPGYYLFIPKYEYLFNIYSTYPLPFSTAAVKGVGGSINSIIHRIALVGHGLLKFCLENFFDLRVFLLFLTTLILLLLIFGKKPENRVEKRTISIFIPICGVIYAFIPSLPNSLAEMYQGNVNVDNFTSLPVSYFLYFSVCLAICSIIWKAFEMFEWKYMGVTISIAICLYSIPLQAMNSAFSHEQYENYSRMVRIEELFRTETMKNMDKQTIFAPDLYKQENALAMRDGYWQQFAKKNNLVLEIHNTDEYKDEAFSIYYQGEKSFVLIGGNEIVVLTKSRLNGNLPVQIAKGKYISANFDNAETDGVFYRYRFLTDGMTETNKLQTNTSTKAPFGNMYIKAGNTLAKANIIDGIYEDKWIGKTCEFEIESGKEGKLIFTGFYPNKLNGEEKGTIFVNDKATMFTITNNSFTIEIGVPANSLVKVKIKNDFSFLATPPDIRELSFLLTDVNGK